jgi:ribose transport system ATP-binding protein
MTLVQLTGIKKSFGATRALDGIDLDVRRGEVYALIGENGAGKSTLMNIIAGALAPDAGEMRFASGEYRPLEPQDARRQGIAHIHQELSVCPHLSVAENILLGVEPAHRGWLDRAAMHNRAAEILEAFHHPAIAPERRVAELPIAARQIVEISRALAQNASLILMDEPTSSIPRGDVERLFACIHRLRDSGISVIYISHFLEEVREVADRYTVLRDGVSVMSGSLREATDAEIITAMVGRPVEDLYPPRRPIRRSARLFEVRHLSAPPAVRDATFELYPGEVLGISGLVGSGRTEMIRALLGLLPAAVGEVVIGNKPFKNTAQRSRAQALIAHGVGYLSEDRIGEGLALRLSVADNISLTNFASCSRGGWLNLAVQAEQTRTLIQKLRIKARDTKSPVAGLSGGNQQKVAIARLLYQEAEILLLDEPTRGVDVGSKVQIYEAIAEMATSGKAVLIISSYLPELFGICDRLAVMVRGRLSPARPIREWTPESLMLMALGSDLNSDASVAL